MHRFVGMEEGTASQSQIAEYKNNKYFEQQEQLKTQPWLFIIAPNWK